LGGLFFFFFDKKGCFFFFREATPPRYFVLRIFVSLSFPSGQNGVDYIWFIDAVSFHRQGAFFSFSASLLQELLF